MIANNLLVYTTIREARLKKGKTGKSKKMAVRCQILPIKIL